MGLVAGGDEVGDEAACLSPALEVAVVAGSGLLVRVVTRFSGEALGQAVAEVVPQGGISLRGAGAGEVVEDLLDGGESPVPLAVPDRVPGLDLESGGLLQLCGAGCDGACVSLAGGDDVCVDVCPVLSVLLEDAEVVEHVSR